MAQFTRKNFLELFRDGLSVIASGRNSNRHTNLVEAGEHAEQHAREINSVGEYEVRIDGGLYYMVKITELVLSAEVPITVPPETQAEFSLGASSYSGDENTNIQFTINRTIRTDQTLTIDWAVTNATVSPLSGTETFNPGDASKSISVLAGDIVTTEIGDVTISNPQYVSGTFSAPLLGSPFTATFTVVNLGGAPSTNISQEMDFESGEFRSSNAAADPDGIIRGNVFFFTFEANSAPRTITNITKANPAIATYTGVAVTDGIHLTLGSISSGMVELSGRLIAVRNPVGNTFEVWQDGDDTGYTPVKFVYPNAGHAVQSTNTIGYGTWSGTTTAQEWERLTAAHPKGAGGTGVHGWLNDTNYKSRIVNGSFTPPSNNLGAADPVTALVGSNFFSHPIYYWDLYLSNKKNKPRGNFVVNPGNNWLPEFETIWHSFSIMLPSNYHEEPSRTGDNSRTMVMDMDHSALSTSDVFLLAIQRFTGNAFNSWAIDAFLGYSPPVRTSDIEIAPITEDIGLWTTFVFQFKAHPTNGILKLWKSVGPYLTGQQRAMSLVFDRGVGPVGFDVTPDGWSIDHRQYKFSWHHVADSINSTVQWIGWDQIRTGTEESDGTGFSDVHPFGASMP